MENLCSISCTPIPLFTSLSNINTLSPPFFQGVCAQIPFFSASAALECIISEESKFCLWHACLRTQAINSCGHPQSKHASKNTTYLTLGVDFCLYDPFLSHHKGIVTILQLRGAVEKFWKKDRLRIKGGRNKKRILENKKR